MRWLPSIVLTVYTIALALMKKFIPDNPGILYIYLVLLVLFAVTNIVDVTINLAAETICTIVF